MVIDENFSTYVLLIMSKTNATMTLLHHKRHRAMLIVFVGRWRNETVDDVLREKSTSVY